MLDVVLIGVAHHSFLLATAACCCAKHKQTHTRCKRNICVEFIYLQSCGSGASVRGFLRTNGWGGAGRVKFGTTLLIVRTYTRTILRYNDLSSLQRNYNHVCTGLHVPPHNTQHISSKII